jgi:hypothetical protein
LFVSNGWRMACCSDRNAATLAGVQMMPAASEDAVQQHRQKHQTSSQKSHNRTPKRWGFHVCNGNAETTRTSQTVTRCCRVRVLLTTHAYVELRRFLVTKTPDNLVQSSSSSPFRKGESSLSTVLSDGECVNRTTTSRRPIVGRGSVVSRSFTAALEALTEPGQAPWAIAFVNEFTLSTGASPGFVRRS